MGNSSFALNPVEGNSCIRLNTGVQELARFQLAVSDTTRTRLQPSFGIQDPDGSIRQDDIGQPVDAYGDPPRLSRREDG